MASMPTNPTQRASDPEVQVVCQAVAAVKRGDRDGFAPVVSLFGRRVHALCLTVLRDPASAEDVAQDAFVKAYLNLNRYDPARPFFPWIATIAVRLAFTSLQKRRRDQERHDLCGQEPSDGGQQNETPLSHLVASETRSDLWQAVGALPQSQRAAVHLFYREDMPLADVARSLGVSAGTVKTLLFRARQRLRSSLAESSTPDQETKI